MFLQYLNKNENPLAELKISHTYSCVRGRDRDLMKSLKTVVFSKCHIHTEKKKTDIKETISPSNISNSNSQCSE